MADVAHSLRLCFPLLAVTDMSHVLFLALCVIRETIRALGDLEANRGGVINPLILVDGIRFKVICDILSRAKSHDVGTTSIALRRVHYLPTRTRNGVTFSCRLSIQP